MQRAEELVSLFEKKDSFHHMGTTGLSRVKQKVDEVVEKNAQKELKLREKAAMEKRSIA
jgi:hypothetical protein